MNPTILPLIYIKKKFSFKLIVAYSLTIAISKTFFMRYLNKPSKPTRQVSVLLSLAYEKTGAQRHTASDRPLITSASAMQRRASGSLTRTHWAAGQQPSQQGLTAEAALTLKTAVCACKATGSAYQAVSTEQKHKSRPYFRIVLEASMLVGTWRHPIFWEGKLGSVFHCTPTGLYHVGQVYLTSWGLYIEHTPGIADFASKRAG